MRSLSPAARAAAELASGDDLIIVLGTGYGKSLVPLQAALAAWERARVSQLAA